MTWNFYSIFLTCIGRIVGNFWRYIYLGIVKSFQTLHVHMNNTGKYGYKIGTFMTQKYVFKLVYNFEYSVYVYIWCKRNQNGHAIIVGS